MSDEPELQHEDHCPHPQSECGCSRLHLLDEGRRLRKIILDERRLLKDAQELCGKDCNCFCHWEIVK